jgi:hypothetical protein
MTHDEDSSLEIQLSCGDCGAALPRRQGLNHADIIWVHEQRCRARHCRGCDRPVAATPGFTATETMWMHELECPAGVDPSMN